MKKIQMFVVANLPFLATVFGLQLFANSAEAQQPVPPKADKAAVKVSNAAKGKVAVKAGAVKDVNKAASFVSESGPSFVKSGAVGKDVNQAASFVKEDGPSFVKSGAGAGNVKNVKIKNAANKAKQ